MDGDSCSQDLEDSQQTVEYGKSELNAQNDRINNETVPMKKIELDEVVFNSTATFY